MRKHVYIAYTGGTIGMLRTAHGYKPKTGYLRKQLRAMPELSDPRMPAFTIHEYRPLLDSSNVGPREWVRIARDVAKNYDAYDGFVVLHGTDTMAYTASALPFMLENLGKPVVLTGSQIPLSQVRNDAHENLITALLLAAHCDIPEVTLYFGGKLLRGCRATKVSADSFSAFDSPNFPPLASLGIGIDVETNLVRHPRKGTTLALHEFDSPVVGTLRLFPGISAGMVHNVLRPPLQGLVLEAYGVGNGPDQDLGLMTVLKQATDRGVVIVTTTQCLEGAVSLGEYATGTALREAGCISGHDMTTEAALAKLSYLFSRGYGVKKVRELMQRDLRGEMTRK